MDHKCHGRMTAGCDFAAAETIDPKALTPEVWDYIFMDGPLPRDSAIPAETLQTMRREFEFWYPFDLRVSIRHNFQPFDLIHFVLLGPIAGPGIVKAVGEPWYLQ